MLLSLQTFSTDCRFCSFFVGELKSLYEYLIGKHIHKLIRKSVPYTCSLSVELGFVCWIAYTKCITLESRVVLVSISVAVAFINVIHSEN
jgi:hypothetical protein